MAICWRTVGRKAVPEIWNRRLSDSAQKFSGRKPSGHEKVEGGLTGCFARKRGADIYAEVDIRFESKPDNPHKLYVLIENKVNSLERDKQS